jgi:hypothetical protein
MILLISMFIIYDTKCIASGEKYGLTFDDYIIASLLLYTVRSFLLEELIGCNNIVSLCLDSLMDKQEGRVILFL